jgi:hypothetical protein
MYRHLPRTSYRWSVDTDDPAGMSERTRPKAVLLGSLAALFVALLAVYTAVLARGFAAISTQRWWSVSVHDVRAHPGEAIALLLLLAFPLGALAAPAFALLVARRRIRDLR